MADSEKGKSSTEDAKAKKSLLDDDFSKDFLSSWKSSADDMDFNFEPVNKGKKKAFGFGMDMDFSLDDAFGKMSSFKMDMDDLDFSTSPKKPAKSKEKSEENSAKGNHSDKHDKFTFSFDFNGLDDFSLDVPSKREGKSPNTEKKISESEDLPRQVTDDKSKATEDIISKGLSVCKDAASSKSEDLVTDNGDPDTILEDCAMTSTLLTHLVKTKEPLVSSDMKLTENIQKNDPQSYHEEETSLKKLCPEKEDSLNSVHFSKPSQSNGSPMVLGTAELLMSTDDDMQLKEDTTSDQPHAQVEEMDVSVNIPLDDASTKVRMLEEVEISSPDSEVKNGSSEGGCVSRELPAAVVLTSGTEKLVVDKSSLECSIGKMNISDEKNEVEDDNCLGSAKLRLGAGKPCTTNDMTALPSGARSTGGVQKPAIVVSSVPFRSLSSEPNATNTILPRNNAPGASNSKFPALQIKNDVRTKSSALKDNGEETTHVSSLDKRSYENSKLNGKISDDNRGSSSKEFNKKGSALERIQKNSSARITPRGDVNADSMRNNGKSSKDGLPFLEKMVNNVKTSGSKFRSSAHSEQEAKVSNQEQGKLEKKTSSIASIQKLNIGLGNRLLSQKIEKKMPSLPSLKLTRNTTLDKRPGTPNMQGYDKSLGEIEKSSRLQVSLKAVSPIIIAEKQTPSTPSLKRKPSEAGNMDPENLRLPKRASPSERRLPKVSSRGLEDGVQAQETFADVNGKNVTTESLTPKFSLDQEANMEALKFSLMVDNDANVEKAEACAKELDNICNLLKKKHDEAKELLVRALVNNNNLLMLNHPIYDEKIRAVQRFASRLINKELEVEASSLMSKELEVEA